MSGTETKDGARMIGKNFHGTNTTFNDAFVKGLFFSRITNYSLNLSFIHHASKLTFMDST